MRDYRQPFPVEYRNGVPWSDNTVWDRWRYGDKWADAPLASPEDVAKYGNVGVWWQQANNGENIFVITEKITATTLRVVIYRIIEMPNQDDDFLLPVVVKFIDFDSNTLVRAYNVNLFSQMLSVFNPTTFFINLAAKLADGFNIISENDIDEFKAAAKVLAGSID